MSLKLKLLFYFMIIFLLIMLSVSTLILQREQNLIENEMSERVKILSNTLSQISLEPLLVYEISSLENNVDSIKSEKYVEYARIITSDNLIIASTDRSQEGEIYNGELTRGLSRHQNLLRGFAEIKLLDNTIGYSEVGLSLLPMQEKISENMRIFILISFLSFAAAFLLTNLMIKHLLKPVNSLTKAVRKIPDNKLDLSEIKEKKLYGEVKELYNAISWMYTELKATRSQLIEETKLAAIGKMSSYIAHEIRNPLEAISGAVEIVSIEQKEEKKEENEYLKIIKEEIDSLNNFLNNFMAFARQESVSREFIELETIIKRIIYLFDNLFQASNIEIKLNLEEIPAVEVDEKRIECVLTNIILNSVEAIDDGGFIEIKTYSDQKWVYLSIADTGGGINNEDAEQIFEPFYTTKKHGTGIGLSISKEIIEIHSGKITYQNTDLGSKFIIKLPLREVDQLAEDIDS